MISRASTIGLMLALAVLAPNLSMAAPKADEAAFRELYKDLIETNTSLSAGDCTLAARKLAARLKTAGYPDADLKVFVP